MVIFKVTLSITGQKNMHLFETEEGDKWVCVTCGMEQEEMIAEKKWEWIFDRHDQTLRCSLCGHPDYDIDD
jgi:transcription initiation factor TFIIIB Brf1 subunit/transcription initiation factor TFIIB